jgi:hypothetical protein
MVRRLIRGLAGPAGGAVARYVLRSMRVRAELQRTNFHGRAVSLAGGPALALGATAGAVLQAKTSRVAAASAVAGLGSGAVGLYDDLVGGRPEHAAKGFRGHVGALREGRVTSGLVKIAGVGAAGLAAAALLPRRRPLDVVLGAGVIAGAANLFNLLDLRPGRALKAGIAAGTPLGASGPLGAATALLPADLGEEIMLGDAGANALGALLGTAYTAKAGTFGRLVALAGIVALTAASEKVSFTKVIEDNEALNRIDQWGRRADAVPAPAKAKAPVVPEQPVGEEQPPGDEQPVEAEQPVVEQRDAGAAPKARRPSPYPRG